jgi:beta-lactamase class A
MVFTRRHFLAALPGLACGPAIGRDRGLSDACAAYEAATGGHVGVCATNVSTGRTLAWRADERFVLCSTFKASLAALVLARVDAGRDRLDADVAFGERDLQEWAPVARAHVARGRLTVDAMCAAAVELSDNTCANLLLARVGGPPALTAFWRRIGDFFSRLDHDEPLLNRTPPGGLDDTTTPAAMAGNLRRLILGDVLSAASRARLTGWMIDCRTGADRLRAGLPTSWRTGDKTGNNGKDAFGDLAVTWADPDTPLVICVYTRGGDPVAEQVRSVFEAVGSIASSGLV